MIISLSNAILFCSFRHLNSSNLTKISRPTLLITDALNTKYSQGQRKTKDAQLLSTNSSIQFLIIIVLLL